MINQSEILYGKISISGMPIGVSGIYTGSYDIKPKVTSQTLETKSKLLTKDINILSIPYFETSNEYGKTVIIGE